MQFCSKKIIPNKLIYSTLNCIGILLFACGLDLNDGTGA